jgi:hypothetical protein
VTLQVVDSVTGHRRSFATTPVPAPERGERVGQPHDYCDYGPSFVRVRMRAGDLPAYHAARVEVRIETAGLTATGPFLTRATKAVPIGAIGAVGDRSLSWDDESGLTVAGDTRVGPQDRARRALSEASERARRLVGRARRRIARAIHRQG